LESGKGKSIWDDTLRTIAGQKGFKALRWGVQIEDLTVAQMAIGKPWFHVLCWRECWILMVARLRRERTL
jgi:hypothetical protein